MFRPESILLQIESELTELPILQRMPGDKWLVSSAMQKAIRRGRTKTALSAAASLWQYDHQNFWRRLHVTAMEDCSADSDVVVKVLTATASSTWRRKIGDLKVGLFLTRMLCEAIKSRAADELFLQLERSSKHKDQRERLAGSDDTYLIEIAANENAALIKRAASLWYLSGTQKFTSDIIPQRRGDPEAAKKVLRSLSAPADLVESCISVMGRTGWPLSIFTPILWQEIQKQLGQLQVVSNNIPACEDVEGIPLFGCDMYTRIGQTCFRILKKSIPALKPFSAKQIGLAVFYAEGGLLDRSLTSPFLEELRQAGEEADIENIGLLSPDYLQLRECLVENMTVLTAIRQEQLNRYLTSGAGGQL